MHIHDLDVQSIRNAPSPFGVSTTLPDVGSGNAGSFLSS
jgi:hypothetical protein